MGITHHRVLWSPDFPLNLAAQRTPVPLPTTPIVRNPRSIATECSNLIRCRYPSNRQLLPNVSNPAMSSTVRMFPGGTAENGSHEFPEFSGPKSLTGRIPCGNLIASAILPCGRSGPGLCQLFCCPNRIFSEWIVRFTSPVVPVTILKILNL